MTSTVTHTVQTGTVGGTPINVDLKGGNVGGDPWALKKVTLSQNYVATNPPGYPDRPPMGLTKGNWAPGTIPSGTTRYFHAHEAAALVAAGAASYAS